MDLTDVELVGITVVQYPWNYIKVLEPKTFNPWLADYAYSIETRTGTVKNAVIKGNAIYIN